MDTVVAIVEWELTHNSMFFVKTDLSEDAYLEQVRGLPIGGHLSAALVELVALWREYCCPWPASLEGRLTARYRDNYVVALDNMHDLNSVVVIAAQLTDLLAMPVKFENAGQ